MTAARPSTGALPLWSAGAIFLVGEAGGYLLPLVVGPVARTYAISEGAVGLVVALQLGMFSLAAIALAPRLMRFDPRRTGLFALALVVAGNLLSASDLSLAALLGGRAVAGLGEGIAEAVGAGLVAQAQDADRAFARVFVAVVVMAIIFYLGLPELIVGLDARQLFLGMAAIPLLALPLVLRLQGSLPAPGAAPATVGGRLAVPALMLCAALTLYSISANAAWFYLERIATSIGLSPASFGRLISAAAVVALVGPLLAQWLGTRFGRVLPLSFACCIVGAGGWLATHGTTALPYIIGFAASSTAMMFGHPYFMGLAVEIDPLGRVAAAARGFNGLGSTLAPAVAGGVLTATGSYRGIGWASVLAAALSLALVLAARAMRADNRSAASSPE
jgi:predicted MFS family arabinose efflux permease